MSLFPNYSRFELSFVKGEGPYLYTAEGKRYLDFASGIGVTNLGHCHPRVSEALKNQVDQLWHVSNLFHIRQQEEAAELLCHYSHFDAAFFCNSGAEANEAAIKLARKWGHEARWIEEPKIITFTKSFHGRTLATITATGQDKVKQGFGPLPAGFITVPYQDLEQLKKVFGSQVVAVFLELVQGEGGVRPFDYQFVHELTAWCKEKNILLIVDEVQTGMGRTGELFAFQNYDIQPDIITLAKGLGNGIPVGAMLATEKLTPYLGPGTHGSTFGGNPLAMATTKAVIEEMIQPSFLPEVKEKGKFLFQTLQEEVSCLEGVKEIRGLGLMVGIELNRPVLPLIKELLQEGLICVSAGENVLRLLPPLIVTEAQIKEAVNLIRKVLDPTRQHVLI